MGDPAPPNPIEPTRTAPAYLTIMNLVLTFLSTSQCQALVAQIFSFTAFILMWVGMVRCNMIEFAGAEIGDTSGSQIKMQFGVWYYLGYFLTTPVGGTGNPVYVFEACRGYSDAIELDDYWKSARAFSALTFIFAFVVVISNTVTACTNRSNSPMDYNLTNRWEPPAYLLTCLFSGLTFLFFKSDACVNNPLVAAIRDSAISSAPVFDFPDTCSLGQGGKIMISSTVFWFVSALASAKAYKAEQAEKANVDTAGLDEPL
ncbi:hypothetical protein THAOC_35210, partial [Thalassiosira oceanica]